MIDGPTYRKLVVGILLAFAGIYVYVYTSQEQLSEASSPAPAPEPLSRKEYLQKIMRAPSFLAKDAKARFETYPVCKGGDLDAVKLEMGYAKLDAMLLTIEPLFPSSLEPTFSHLAVLEDLEQGVDVALDTLTQPGFYGMFFCSNQSGSGRCQGKDVIDLNAVFSVYFRQGGVPSSYVFRDKIYIANFFAFDGENVWPLTKLLSEKNYDPLVQHLGGGSEQLSLAWRLYVTLKSYAPRVEGNVVVMRLPGFDRSACGEN